MFGDATHFSEAQFVELLTTESVRETINTLWATVYTRLQNTSVFDDGLQFRDTFVEIYEIHDVEWKMSGTQHHSALEIGERYHEPIKHTLRKHQIKQPSQKKVIPTKISRQSMQRYT